MGFVIPAAIVVAIGVVAGVGLTLASKLMAVKVNENVAQIRALLPGANCGACGFAGCDDYAKSVAEDHTVKANLCTPGGSQVAMEISQVLGVKFEAIAGKYAVLHCAGSREKTNYVMDYQGFQSCTANKLFYRGRGACDKSCLGFGDCAKVCDYDAIAVENGLALINRSRCVGCGRCAKACPNGLIEIVPDSANIVVACSTEASGSLTRSRCDIGCVGCGLCEKSCKFDAIHVEGFRAVIDYDKCRNCGLCIKVCPRKVIKKISNIPAPQ
ncbi:MAG: RnfABCDGE type electron transport complex subunit B [Bacillota bacterium]|nr:RnfABCDGE type electron transport complex subunit B [Bacillota bacterium]